MQTLPAPQQTSVISVRRVKVTIGQQRFAAAQRKYTTSQEVMPTYHGTPERWRATAIALHGFDLNICLHGRASGNGVYSSTDINLPLSYSKGSGSVLQMRGLHGGDTKTVVNGNVYVFPDPAAVLPLYIIDFAARDDKDSAQDNLDYEKLAMEARAQHKRDMEHMKSEEARFREDKIRHFQTALHNFKHKMLHLMTRAQSDDMTCTAAHDLNQRLQAELAQFRNNLPIYAHKEDIIKVLQDHALIIFQSSTGSGKSTQLPQYLRDDIFPGDKRRIAVLQPRRINVVSLCHRISEERFTVPGCEVGYRMGRGTRLIDDKLTEIEFMVSFMFSVLKMRRGVF